MNTYKHLSFRERQKIEDWLVVKKSLRWIGKQLGRDVSTISREIRRNRVK
jgi:IS30 family transposase